jgi:hypothetical protein
MRSAAGRAGRRGACAGAGRCEAWRSWFLLSGRDGAGPARRAPRWRGRSAGARGSWQQISHRPPAPAIALPGVCGWGSGPSEVRRAVPRESGRRRRRAGASRRRRRSPPRRGRAPAGKRAAVRCARHSATTALPPTRRTQAAGRWPHRAPSSAVDRRAATVGLCGAARPPGGKGRPLRGAGASSRRAASVPARAAREPPASDSAAAAGVPVRCAAWGEA